MTLQFNALGAASHRNMFDHVPGPLRSGAVENEVPINGSGIAHVKWSPREPLVLIGIKSSLENQSLLVSLVLNPASDNETLPGLNFAPYSEFGTYLPAFKPPVDPATHHSAPFRLRVRLKKRLPDMSESSVPVNQVKDYLEIVVIEGVLARLAYLLGSEQMRLRRVAREVAMMRSIDTARDSALDRIGAALAVPRFTDEIEYQSSTSEIVTRSLNTDGSAVVEPDEDYRRRLALFSRMNYPTRQHVLDKLNGTGSPGDPNTGPLSELGLADRFEIVERDNDFSFALHLVSTGSDSIRLNFLKHLRDTILIAPRRALENSRFLSSTQRSRQSDLRSNLRGAFNFENNHYLAPMLAVTLERVARCRHALLGGSLQKRNILRAQADNAGSRYELGLGVDVQPLTAAERNLLVSRLQDPNRAPAADKEIEGVLKNVASKIPPSAATDTEARWFFTACGMRTVHRINANRIYLSHLPTSGLVIEGAANTTPDTSLPLTARHHAELDPGANALLLDAVQKANDQWIGLGEAGWTQLSQSQGRNRWDNAVIVANANAAFSAADLPALSDVSNLSERLQRVPADLIVTLRLANSLSAQVMSNHSDAKDRLRNLKRVFEACGFASMLPLATTGNQVVVVASVIGLPGVGANLAARRSAGFRWYVVPLQGNAGDLGSIGSQTTYKTNAVTQSELAAVVAVGYARNPENTDPYEFRVELPDHVRLNIKQYEFLMNLLGHAYPLGVEINTWQIRQQHVDLDGDGAADALSPNVARTFRRFRRLRHRGEIGVDLTEKTT